MRKRKIAISGMAALVVAAAFTACGQAQDLAGSTGADDVSAEGGDGAGAETALSGGAAQTAEIGAGANGSDGATDGADGDLAALLAEAAATSVAEQTYVPTLPTERESAGIFLAPVEGLPEGFIRGMDVSSVLAEEASGVVYKDWDGVERDLFEILADAGVNYIRVRVWNNPYDAEGNGYGGGNSDVAKAAQIGARAAAHGMKLLVDFHYSDFWADPNKQYAPSAWARRDLEEKTALINEYTQEALATIIAGGADVGMVQIGNEINKGVCGVYEVDGVMQLLSSASAGVRSVAEATGRDIKVVVHYTGIDDATGTVERARTLADHGVDYDIFGVSYYPYWHDSMENMKDVLRTIGDTFGVATCVMETSYPYTSEDGDGFGNSVATGGVVGYPDSVQGQAKEVRDVADYAAEAGALGFFYWEGAWVPVGSDYESNYPIWEAYGSGWASSHSVAYDPQDAGQYYGGCSWDNQAMFDFRGQALESLKVFGWLDYGTDAPLEAMAYEEVYIESGLGEDVRMPETIGVYYNDPSVTEGMAVVWNAEDLAAVDVRTARTYEVGGVTAAGDEVTARVKVMNINYLQNPSFEDADISMWVVPDAGSGNPTDRQTKASDALSGENALHFYSTDPIDFKVYQEITGLHTGDYAAIANIQGGDMGPDAQVCFFVVVNNTVTYSPVITLKGWQQWQTAELRDIHVTEGETVYVGMEVKGAAKGWGTIDDLEFFSQNIE